VLHFFKISFRQIFSKSKKTHNKFAIYFGVISLALCLSALTLVLCFSKGFKDQINLKLSSIDGHYRINSKGYYPTNSTLTEKSLVDIEDKINKNPSLLSYSIYTEDYALANISGGSEGLLIYGIDPKEAFNIFNINFPYIDSKSFIIDDNEILNDTIPISIGSGLAEDYNLVVGDIFFIFPFKLNTIGSLPDATKVVISHIFNSGFSEYDKSVCFIDLANSRSIFNYGTYFSGLVGTVRNPIKINDDFQNIFGDFNDYRVTTWIDRHNNISEWLDVYADPILFIILLITVLAIFNMSLSLWISIQDKLKELSILFTLGFTKKKIVLIVIFQNIILTLASIFIAFGLSSLILYLQYRYKIIRISEDIYFIDYLPVTFDYISVFKYYELFFFISILISIIPALKLYFLDIIKHISAND